MATISIDRLASGMVKITDGTDVFYKSSGDWTIDPRTGFLQITQGGYSKKILDADTLNINGSPVATAATRGATLATDVFFLTKSANITATDGTGYVALAPQASNPSTPATGFRLFATALGKLAWKGTNGFVRIFDGTANTADRTYTLPDTSGTLAIASETLRRIISSNVQLANTGNTTENTVYTGTIPASSITANGSFHIIIETNWTNNANAKTFKIKFNGTIIYQYAPTTSVGIKDYMIMRNRNATNVQAMIGPASSTSNYSFHALSSSAVTAYAFDTTAAITVTITVQCANGADTGSVEGFEINAIG